jgi:hypothetical protein
MKLAHAVLVKFSIFTKLYLIVFQFLILYIILCHLFFPIPEPNCIRLILLCLFLSYVIMDELFPLMSKCHSAICSTHCSQNNRATCYTPFITIDLTGPQQLILQHWTILLHSRTDTGQSPEQIIYTERNKCIGIAIAAETLVHWWLYICWWNSVTYIFTFHGKIFEYFFSVHMALFKTFHCLVLATFYNGQNAAHNAALSLSYHSFF